VDHRPIKVAYILMEIALDPDIPTYAGGLGALAGDMLRSATGLGVPILARTLVLDRVARKKCGDLPSCSQ
jgi:starch phosphorylase